MEEKELFQEYELKNWEFSPRFYKIIGVALAAHLLAATVVAQLDIFGSKACDSPYVGKVCRVLETAYIAATLLGTDTEFSSRDYEKTEIAEDLSDVTFIDVSEQFTYPSGYFDLSNPVPPPTDIAMMNQGGTTFTPNGSIPGIPDSFGSPQTLDPNKPAVLPTPNPNAVQGNIPNSPLGALKDFPQAKIPKNFPKLKQRPFPSLKTQKNPTLSNDSPKVLPPDEVLAEKEKANKDKATDKDKPKKDLKEDGKKPETVAKSDGDPKTFNKKPLEDFGNEYGNKILSKEVDINAPFEIQVVAKLDENGKLIKPVMKHKEGSDLKMTEVAKEAISAFGDSQLLKTLYNVGGRNVKITFAQNADNLQAIIQAETDSENKAKSLQSSLNLFLKNVTFKEGSDEQILMNKAQFSTEGKNFIINFLIPNEEKTKMIEKNLRSLQEKQKKSGNAETQTTGKVVSAGK